MKLPTLARLKALSATPSALLAIRSVSGANILGSGFSGGGYFSFPRSAYVDGHYYTMQSASYAMMWTNQPEIRSVVGFVAQNFMQVPLDLYNIQPSRATPDTNHPCMESIRNPRPNQGMGALLEGIAADLLVFDNAYLLKVRVLPLEQTTLLRIPPYAVGVRGSNRLIADSYRITYTDGTHDDFRADEMIHIPAYNALDPRIGVSRMEALRQILIDSATRRAASVDFNISGRVRGGVIERPLDAPALNDTGKEALESDVSRKMSGKGSRVVTLDEGMHWNDAGVNPREADVIRATTLTYVEVCHAFGLHPDVMGVREQSAGLVEARKQMYMDVLPPLGDRMAEAFRVQMLESDYLVKPNTKEFRFDWQEKLEGDPIERSLRATSAAGGPILTRNEARALIGYSDLPAGEGGDKIIVPTNVLVGGGSKPTPQVMPVPDANKPAQDGTHRQGDPNVAKDMHEDMSVRMKSLRIGAAIKRGREYHAEHEMLMQEYFGRQERSLERGGKADSLRWDQELEEDLLKLSQKTVKREGELISSRLMGDFDMSQVENYLAAGAKAAAIAVNKITAAQLAGDSTFAEVFDRAKTQRADEFGRTQATHLLNFAANESATQNPGPEGTRRVKTWNTTNENSRHKALNQESVYVGKTFSDGSRFPGDPKVKDYSHNANCRCVLDVI
jgi:HK97 family phage portal protein